MKGTGRNETTLALSQLQCTGSALWTTSEVQKKQRFFTPLTNQPMLDEFSTDCSTPSIPAGLLLRTLLLVNQAVPARFRGSAEDVFRFKTAEDYAFKPNPEQSESQPPPSGGRPAKSSRQSTHHREGPHSPLLPSTSQSTRSSLIQGLNTIFSQ